MGFRDTARQPGETKEEQIYRINQELQKARDKAKESEIEQRTTLNADIKNLDDTSSESLHKITDQLLVEQLSGNQKIDTKKLTDILTNPKTDIDARITEFKQELIRQNPGKTEEEYTRLTAQAKAYLEAQKEIKAKQSAIAALDSAIDSKLQSQIAERNRLLNEVFPTVGGLTDAEKHEYVRIATKIYNNLKANQ